MLEQTKPFITWAAVVRRISRISAEILRSITPKQPLPDKVLRILLWGPQRSGKTAILYRWKLDSFIDTTQTFGVLEESFHHDCPACNCLSSVFVAEIGRDPQSYERKSAVILPMKDEDGYDQQPRRKRVCRCLRLCCAMCFGARSRARCLDFSIEVWVKTASRANAVVYVVDATCRNSIARMFGDINTIIENDHLAHHTVKVVILANKQDVYGAVSPEAIETMLDLPPRVRHRFRVLGCSAKSGVNVDEALCWLATSGCKAD